MIDIYSAYIAAGGNRHPSAADWDPRSGLLAYGSHQNVALWNPLVRLSTLIIYYNRRADPTIRNL